MGWKKTDEGFKWVEPKRWGCRQYVLFVAVLFLLIFEFLPDFLYDPVAGYNSFYDTFRPTSTIGKFVVILVVDLARIM